MQDHSHLMQFLHMVGFWLLWYRFRFTSTRAHGVPFVPLSTPRAHILPLRFKVLTAVGAMLPPTPPSIRLHSLVKHIHKKAPIRLAVWGFQCKFATAIYSRKTHTSTFDQFPNKFGVKSAVCKEVFPSLTSPLKQRI